MNLPPPQTCQVAVLCAPGTRGHESLLAAFTNAGCLCRRVFFREVRDNTFLDKYVGLAIGGDSWAGGSRTIHPSGVQPNYMVDKLRVPPHHSKLWQTFYKITRRDEVRAEDIGQVWATGQLAISPAPQKCKQSEGLGRQAGPSNVTAKCPPGHTLKRGLGAPRSDHERSACKVDGVFSEVIPATCSAG